MLFLEPTSPQASASPSTSPSASTSNDSAKPSISGILKKAVTAPSTQKLVNDEPDMEKAIESVGEDGEKAA
jgi:hypothetical protein